MGGVVQVALWAVLFSPQQIVLFACFSHVTLPSTQVAVLMVFQDCLWMIGLFYSKWSFWMRQSQSDKISLCIKTLAPLVTADGICFASAHTQTKTHSPSSFVGIVMKSKRVLALINLNEIAGWNDNTQECRFMEKRLREISRFLLRRDESSPPPSARVHALRFP